MTCVDATESGGMSDESFADSGDRAGQWLWRLSKYVNKEEKKKKKKKKNKIEKKIAARWPSEREREKRCKTMKRLKARDEESDGIEDWS